MTQLGIEEIKENILRVYNIYKDVAAKLDDGKLSWPERIALLPKLYTVYLVYNDAPAFIKEWQDINSNERVELKEWFADTVEMENKKAERIIEKIWNILVESSQLTQEFK